MAIILDQVVWSSEQEQNWDRLLTTVMTDVSTTIVEVIIKVEWKITVSYVLLVLLGNWSVLLCCYLL